MRTIAELPGFSFATHHDFVAAVRSRQAAIGIDFAAARNMLGVTNSRRLLILVEMLTWIPALLALTSVALAIGRADWLVLTSIPAVALAFVVQSPYVPLHKLAQRVGIVAAIYVLLTGSPIDGLRWTAVSFGGSMFIFWYVRSVTSECARAGALESEAFAAFLFKSKGLHIWDAAGRSHSIAQQETRRV